MSPHQPVNNAEPPQNDSRLSQEEKEACESPVPRRSSSESKRSFNKSEPSPVRKKEGAKKERNQRAQSQQELPKHESRASRKVEKKGRQGAEVSKTTAGGMSD